MSISQEEQAERIAYLIALEIARIVDELELRQTFLLDMWSKHRDRGPFLDTLQSRYKTLSFPDLALLPSDAVAKVDEFYRELEEFRLYFQFTEDMPIGLAEAYAWQLFRLNAYAEQAVDSLGGTPERPLLDLPDEAPDAAPVPDDKPLLQLEHFEKPPELES